MDDTVSGLREWTPRNPDTSLVEYARGTSVSVVLSVLCDSSWRNIACEDSWLLHPPRKKHKR